MPSVSVYDTNFHPVFDKNRVESEAEHLANLELNLRSQGVIGALSVDLPGLNGHLTHEEFVLAHTRSDFFTPVPALRPGLNPKRQIASIEASGAKLVKVHPRFLGIDYQAGNLKQIIRLISESNLGLLLCCYPYSKFRGTARNFHLVSLLEFLAPKNGFTNTLLMHGGGPQFLDVAEWARHQDGVLLDLSFTLTQFAKTSLRFDLRGSAPRFDQRMTIGSDSPHEDFDHWIVECGQFLADLPEESRLKISYLNIRNFLGNL